MVEQWLVAVVGRVIVGACRWQVKMVGCGSEGVGWQVGMIVAVKAVAVIEAVKAVAVIKAVIKAVMAVAMIVAGIAVAVIGGCGWPVNDGWLWLAEFWLVRSLLAVIGRLVMGCGWPGDAWL